MIGFGLGLLYANAGEWLIHKHVLHGLGRDRKSMWSFHWHEHHRNVRTNDHIDPCYERPLLGWHAQGKEALGVFALGALHLPLLPVAPGFAMGVMYSAWNYYRVHKRSHMEPDWARAHLTWHYDHHMGPNQDANWCVTRPWFDKVMGTYEPYAGTEKELRDMERRARHRARRDDAAQGEAPGRETPTGA